MQHQRPKNSDTQRKPSPASSAPASPWIPNSALPPVHPESINSIVRKILLATPEFPRLYADMVLSTRPNSAEAKILRPKYQQILYRINLMQNSKTCTHIKISGIRCGSPSLRGEQFCYYHQRMHRGVRTPPQSRLHPLACIEDKESIQAALAEVINALLRNTIDMKRATLILRALHIAVKNDARASVKAQPSNIVKEVPEYDETTPSHVADGLVDLNVPFEASFGQDPRASRPQRAYKTPEQFEKDRDEMIANYYGFPTAEAHAAAKEKGWTPYTQAQQTAKKTEAATAHVGTAAAGCPGGPAVSVRSAVAPSALSPHDFTKPATTAAESSHPPPALNPVNSVNSGTVTPPRKPPTPVPETPAKKNERKYARGEMRSRPEN
jgi:hypothetical protein